MEEKRFLLNFCGGPACSKNNRLIHKPTADEVFKNREDLKIVIVECMGHCRNACNAELYDHTRRTRDIFNGIKQEIMEQFLQDIANKMS